MLLRVSVEQFGRDSLSTAAIRADRHGKLTLLWVFFHAPQLPSMFTAMGVIWAVDSQVEYLPLQAGVKGRAYGVFAALGAGVGCILPCLNTWLAQGLSAAHRLCRLRCKLMTNDAQIPIFGCPLTDVVLILKGDLCAWSANWRYTCISSLWFLQPLAESLVEEACLFSEHAQRPLVIRAPLDNSDGITRLHR